MAGTTRDSAMGKNSGRKSALMALLVATTAWSALGTSVLMARGEADGSMTFVKRVKVDQARAVSGTLSDTATVKSTATTPVNLDDPVTRNISITGSTSAAQPGRGDRGDDGRRPEIADGAAQAHECACLGRLGQFRLQRADLVVGNLPNGSPDPVCITHTCGEGGALVRGINGEAHIPPGRKVRSSDFGVNGLPTLLSNAETFAQLAIAARVGPPAGDRALGAPGERGDGAPRHPMCRNHAGARRHAAALLPMIQNLLRRAGAGLDDGEAAVPEAGVGEVDADDLPELLRAARAARLEQV